MATSGTFYGPYGYGSGSSVGWRLRLYWEVKSQDKNNLTSTVELKLYILDNTGYSRNEVGDAYYTLYDSTKNYFKYNYSTTGEYFLGSKTVLILHLNDGTKSVTLSAFWNGENYTSYTPSILEVSGTAILPTIVVCTAATISSVTSLVSFGGNCSISVVLGTNNSSSNCTYKLTYSCNGQTGTVSSEKSTNYSFSTNNFNLIKNNTSDVTCTLTLTTYWNNNSVGSNSKSFTIIIPSPASNFNVSLGEETDYWFDREYSYSFTDNSSGKYTYKLKIGTDNLIDASSSNNSTLTVSSALCVNAISKNIDIYLYTYNGNAVFSDPQKVTELFNILNNNNYKPTFTLSRIVYNDMPNNSIFLNGSRQSSIVLEGTFHGGKAGESNYCGINSISTNKGFINILSWDGFLIIIYLTALGYENTPITFTITDTRGRNTEYTSETGLGDITVKNYIPLSIKDVKVYNEYTQDFLISYNLLSTDNDSAEVNGIMILGDNSSYSLVKDDDDQILRPDDLLPLYPGSVLSKTITIIARLYGDELPYTLYLAPQEKALNLYNGNKVIRVGGMAGEVDSYILLMTLPIDWNNNNTYYYKKQYSLLNSEPEDWESNKTNYYKQVNNEYVSVESTDNWAANTYYSLEYVSVISTDTWANNTYYQKRDKWGLVVGNFDLTITDTEIAILKNKFGI